MKFKDSYFLGFVSCIILLFCSYTASAQNFPEFSLSNDIESDTSKSDENFSDLNLNSPLMRDILVLQNQVNLLESLLERQAEIDKIAANYQSMGLAFNQPKPPQSACEKLPSNILCLYAYPGLQINQDFIETAKQNMAFKQQQALQEALMAIESADMDDTTSNSAASNLQLPKKIEYFWTDIQCLENKCSVLIQYEGDRLRMREGDSLNDMTITSISFDGVMADVGDKEIVIKPLSLDGDSVVVAAKEKQKPVLFDNIIDKNVPEISDASNNPIKQPQAFFGSTDSEPSETTNGPLLGPTGLF